MSTNVNRTVADPTMEVAGAESGQAAPRLITLEKTGKKKLKYSKGLGEFQRADRALSKASVRISRAIADGFATYQKRSEKSAEKQRDGAIKDAVQNWSKAFSKVTTRAGKAPYALAKAMNTRRMQRRARDLVRMLTPFFPR
jgi:hypothetical protein